MAVGLGDVRLADSSRADQENVLVTVDEAAGREVDDLALGSLRVEGEVKVIEGPFVVEARPPQPERQLLAFAAIDLVGEQTQQEFGGGRGCLRQLVCDAGLELSRMPLRRSFLRTGGRRCSLRLMGLLQGLLDELGLGVLGGDDSRVRLDCRSGVAIYL